MTMDPAYIADVITWLLVWAAAGLSFREWLAGKPARDRQHDRAARR